MKKIISTIAATGLLASAIVLGATGTASAAAKLKIAHIPKLGTIGYFQAADRGVQKACKELGATCAYRGPAEITAAAQVKEINAAVQRGDNVILVAANDTNALCPALTAAQKKGVTVVAYDSDVKGTCRSLFVNQATSDGIGNALADDAAALAGSSGDIAILSTTPTATNQNVWIDFMNKRLAAKYPNVKVVATVYGNDKPEDSTNETKGLLDKYPNLKVIVAPTSIGIVAAAKFVDASAKKGKVFVTGLGLPSDMSVYVKSGTAHAALWDVENFGYVSVYVANDIRNNKAKTAVGTVYKSGPNDSGLKQRTVTKGAVGNELVLGPALVFTKDNIDNYKF